MNKIILVGRLTKDPELQTTNNGTSLLRFNVACKSKLRDEDGEQKVDFFVCVAWREKAELIHKYCKKGSMLQISGSMGSRSYEKQDGTRQTIWEINVEDVECLSSINEESAEDKEKTTTRTKSKATPKQAELTPLDDADDENLPFWLYNTF